MRRPKRVDLEAIKRGDDMPRLADYLDRLWERQTEQQKREERR